MKYVKKYEEMSHNLKSLESKIIGLDGEARNIDAEYEPLDNEYLKLRVLEDSRADAKKAELVKMRERRAKVKEEIEEAKKSKQIMIAIINEYRDKARHEINDQYSKIFLEKVKVFVKRLREAEDLERELFELRKEARLALTKQIDASESFCNIPAWPEVLLPSMKNGQVGEVKSFVNFMKGNSNLQIDLS